MRGIIFIMLAIGGCGGPVHTGVTPRPMVASMQPVAPEAPAAEAPEPDDSAGDILERAFRHFANNRFKRASSSFSRALSTGNLNDAGRALSYWHVYVCETQLGNEDRAAEALMSFIVVGDDIVEEESLHPYRLASTSDFSKRFQLPQRISRARAIISATWARRASTFGRVQENPIPVRTNLEQNFFLELSSHCQETQVFTVKKIQAPAAVAEVEHIRLSCGESDDEVDFFFERVE